jgi:hypothetical protein
MNIFTLINSLYVEAPVEDETLWYKRLRAPLFATTVDGEILHSGQI